jgi:HK97 family phage portal protein
VSASSPGRLRLALRSVTTNILRATDGRDVLLNSPSGWEVEQPWLFWTGPGNGTLGPFGHPIPGAGGNGYGAIPAVSRATNLIVNTLGTLPWHVYRDGTEQLPTPDWIADPQALRLDERIVDPTAVDETRWSYVDFWAQWIRSALWFGDGFVYVPTRDAAGLPKPPLWQFHPADVELRDGRYRVGDTDLGTATIIHLRRGPIVDGRGTGVFDQFVADLGLAASLRDYVSGAYTAGVPAGYLKTSAPHMDQAQADELKARWLSQHGGVRRSIAVLNATTDFMPLTWSPHDLAATEFAQLSLGTIANMFDEPAYVLGAPTDSNTYANVESRQLELYQMTWLPWARAIEAVINAQFPRGVGMKIAFEGILRADTKTRYETYDIARKNEILTVDEIRELENRPPLVTEGVM